MHIWIGGRRLRPPSSGIARTSSAPPYSGQLRRRASAEPGNAMTDVIADSAMRDDEQCAALPTHYLFGAIPLARND